MGLTATRLPKASSSYAIEDTGISVDGSNNVTGVVGLTATTLNATTFDTNVAAAGVTLAGTTLAADGTDAHIGITITPKGDGVIALPGPAQVDKDGNVTAANMTCTTAYIGAGGAVVYGTAPQIILKDVDATAGDDNVTIAVSATDIGNGTEDVDIVISQQIAGAPVALLTADADGTIAFDTTRIFTTGAAKLGDGGSTNYAAFAADGELTLAGTARVKKKIVIDNGNLGKGASAPTEVIIGNYNAWEFDIDDDAVIDAAVPKDWASGTDITILVCWYINEAYATASGEVRWQAAWSACPHDASEAIDAPAHGTTDNSGDINIPATAKYLTETLVETIPAANLAAGDELGITIKRVALGGGADPTADPAVVHVELEYTADKLGTAT